ncbi:MAG TPA: ATP-binding protein [Herpetosiphonaceae bacterium]|nr:ATP-binding protein [Herpetosiphonaceae bacterium]
MSTASASLSIVTGRVLVVDDEPHMGTICAQTLRLDAHSVETTTDPLAALELLQRSHFDVLLTDISMPEMSGLELAHRAHLHQPALGVVMMTGYASYENMAAALRQGVADFLPKPFEMAQLRLTITRALQRQRLIHENVRLQSLVDLLEASQQFSASLDPTRISSAIVRAIQRVSGMNCVHVNLVEAGTLVDSGVAHDGVCMLADARIGVAEANGSGGERQAPNVIRFPLNAADEHVGEVVLATDHVAVQTRVLTAVVQMLANHGAVALHNARLYTARAELDHQKSEFITIASHELRTPLSIILGYSSMLRDKLVGQQSEYSDYVDQVVRAGLRINDIIDDLINVRHLDVGEAVTKFTEVSLQEVIDAAVEELRPLAAARGVRLDVRHQRRSLILRADREKLMMVFANLTANGIRFTRRGGSVTIVSGLQKPSHGGNLVVAVRDTGIGIPTHELRRIFDRFYQVAEARTREHGGVGLGLAIARGFVELHQGSIDVESEPGRGSLFVVTLPSYLLLPGATQAGVTDAAPGNSVTPRGGSDGR